MFDERHPVIQEITVVPLIDRRHYVTNVSLCSSVSLIEKKVLVASRLWLTAVSVASDDPLEQCVVIGVKP